VRLNHLAQRVFYSDHADDARETIIVQHHGDFVPLKKDDYSVEQLRDIGRIAAVMTAVSRVMAN
jgi:hypothetical protein